MHWPGSASLTFDDLQALIGNVAEFYRRVDQAGKAMSANVSLPAIRKANAKKAPRWVFCLTLADRFQPTFGAMLDPVVSALCDVVFDLEGAGPGSSTLRGLRRWARRAADSNQKPK
jgi:hypothetical protein